MTGFNTIIFDLGGVLMQHNIPGCIAAFRSLMSEEAMHNVLGLCSDGEGAHDTLMERYERGTVTTAEFVATIKQHCRPGTTDSDITSAWITMHDHIPQERLDYIKELRRKGYRTCLLSNNNDLHWRDVCEHYPVDECFDRMFLSHEMHLSKPDPAMFRAISEALGTEPESTVFIDDLAANREAAATAVGWHTCASVDELKNMLGKL